MSVTRCPNCPEARGFKSHAGCFGQNDCPFPVRNVDRTAIHVRAALTIAKAHRTESVAWDDVCVLLEDLVLAE